MAGTVADYVVILDVHTDLKASAGIDDKTFPFTLPSTAAVATQHSILSLMVHSMGAANNLKANVSINGVKVWGYGPTNADLTRPFHEVLKTSENALKPGNNTLKIQVEGGQGTFRVSDIVIWFQNNV